MGEVDRVKSLINGLQRKQPKIYEALSAVARKLDLLDEDIAAVTSELRAIPETGLAIAPNVTIFVYELTTRNVILRWAQPDTSIFAYEIKTGADWDSGSTILRTSTLSAVFDPLPVGTTKYWIKGIDFDGNVSADALGLDVIIPSLGNININAIVIDNYVLFQWTEPASTWEIDYYNLYKGIILIGKQKGTFAVTFETVAGTFTYKIVPIDIAGNIGPESSVSAEVKAPPDFDLIASGIDDLSGTKVNTVISNSRLLANINTTETWEEHFIDNGWTTIQDQLDDDFPIYLQPTPSVGTYERVFDFGAIFDNFIVNLVWNQNQLFGETTVTSEIAYSDDNITYTSYVAGRTLFIESARYVKVKFTFTGITGEALLEFYGLVANLNVKAEVDSGHVNADKDDVDGTTVLFNKDFKDVNSITLTTQSLEPVYTIYAFDDIPNPDGFEVFAFDSAGNRIDYLVSWKARGIT